MNFTHIAQPVAVSARVILAITEIPEGTMLSLDDTSSYFANQSMMARYTPIPGDYLVTQADGYAYLNPKHVFERKYTPVSSPEQIAARPEPGAQMCFSGALLHLKGGAKIARVSWNGNGMFVYLVPANAYPAQTNAAKAYFGHGALVPYNEYLAIKGADDTVSTWAPSVGDTLAEDWLVVD